MPGRDHTSAAEPGVSQAHTPQAGPIATGPAPPRPADGAPPPTGPPAPEHKTRPGGRGNTNPAQGRAGRAVLTAHDLQARYDGFTALDGVDLTVPSGRITAIIGPNGAGKSTLFHCLAGTVRPSQGQVRYGDRNITHLSPHGRTRLGIARTFQQLAVFPTLTVAENIQVGAEQGHITGPAATDRALRLFALDGPLRNVPAAGLPTGTLRRVELARALAGTPNVLLLDEPAAGLDSAEVTALARVLKALAADGTALLVVEHDLDLVADLADVVHVMTAGRIIASGPPAHVLDSFDAREPAV